jgi:membrane protein YqaA with SNARE-associated domain
MRHSRILHSLFLLGIPGVFAIAFIDFSIIPLPLPNSADLLLLWLVARGGNPWALVPSVVAGSILGGYTTWHIGWKGGRPALRRYVSVRLLKPASRWITRHPILSAFVFPMLPPPIPLTPFVLASGALGAARRPFFIAFGVALSLRYSLIAWLGATYGRYMVRLWAAALRKWSAPLFWAFVALLMGSIGFGVWRLITRSRSTFPRDQLIEGVVSKVD